MSGSLTKPKFSASGSLAATGSTDGYALAGPFNFTLSGTWVGTVALEATVDNGATWVNCVMPDGSASAFGINGFYAVPDVWQRGVLFRLTFTRTSGTAAWSISQ
jgi:hypothetical protein